MPILLCKRGLRRFIVAFVLVVLIAASIWIVEGDQILSGDDSGTINCGAYKGKINSLYELLPEGITSEERCEMTPLNCGPTGLIFNSPGMETYYYRSACYADLAQSTLDVRFCEDVVERRSLLFDGHYYSREACLERVTRSLADRAAPKIGDRNIARIDTLTAEFDPQHDLIIQLKLAPERPVPGHYAISAMAILDGATDVTVALNPEHPAISHDQSYARLRPVSNWILRLDPEYLVPELRFAVDSSQLREYLHSAGSTEFSLEVQLQFLESADGALADPAEHRDVYISQQSLRVPF